jgi:hypothetical protein
MCCLRSRSEHATPLAGRQKLLGANENRLCRPPHAGKQRPARWRDFGILATVAPTLTIVTLVATYFFGIL